MTDDVMFYSIDESFAAELKAKLASSKPEKVTFTLSKEKKVPKADVEEEAVVSQPVLVKRTNKGPVFFFTENDEQMKLKLQRYSTMKNSEVERKKWSVFKAAFWKNAKNLRRKQLRQLAPGKQKNNKSRGKKAKAKDV
uniref:60S ribosomal protein L14 n=1 Tax=Panagrolaimus sp. JU765 TaxID=591449 RepID=A0AC34QMZ0_9BILA